MRHRLVVLGALLAVGCASPPDPQKPAVTNAPVTLAERMRAYATDPSYRRAALEESLVVRDNGYAQTRLAHYTEEGWGALPVWNPRTTPMRDGEGGLGPVPASGDAAWTALDDAGTDWSEEALRDLGEKAFFAYPVQLAAGMRTALTAPDHAGVWKRDGAYSAVWAETKGSPPSPAFTCATCHSTLEAGRVVPGKNNADLDGAAIMGGFTWGRGRVDVTADDSDNPVAITDLRPVRYQLNLHHAATLKNDPVALAVRIETLIITANNRAVRPPRRVTAALAVYLLSLSAGAPPRETSSEGARVFAKTCVRCHDNDGATGPAVSLASVGTDPRVGESAERGTGHYRVPSLRHVGDRRRMFASGDIDDVDALLDPNRTVAGHRYGLDLPAGERAALLAYLKTL